MGAIIGGILFVWFGIATGLFKTVIFGVYELIVSFLEGILPFSIGGVLGVVIFILIIVLILKAIFK